MAQDNAFDEILPVHNSDCGCGECEKQGNFTYIRWASDDQGSDFSSSRTADAISRCWQAIITSPIALDETTPAFAGLFFNKWFNVCESTEDCECGCSWGIYKTPGGHPMPKNGWRYTGSTSPNTIMDALYQNWIQFVHTIFNPFSTGDMIGNIQLPSFDGALISGGQTFTVQFDLVENLLYGILSADEYIELSFGDGYSSTKFRIDNTTIPNPYQLIMTASDGGTFTADKLVINFKKTTAGIWGSGFPMLDTMTIKIANIRIGEAGCYRPYPDTIGESNTGNNIGTNGVGIYDSKVGPILNFRKINSASPKIQVSLDAVNHEVLLDVDQSQLELQAGQVTDFDAEVSNNSDVAANTAARHDAVTVSDSDTIDFTLIAQALTAIVKDGSIGADKLSAAVVALLHEAATVSDSNTIDFTLTGQEITGVVKDGSIDSTKLSAAVVALLHSAATVLNSDTIDFSITGQQITGIVKDGSIGTDKLSAAVLALLHNAVTVVDSDTIDLTLTGQQITADVKNGSIGTSQLTAALQLLINKLTFISVTQNVDLDQMETDIAALSNGMVYKGSWDASSGIFPGGGVAKIGWFYYVSVAGIVDGVDFNVGDNLVAINNNASTTSYADWNHHDQTDAVQSVAGKTGVVTLVAADITDFDTEVSNNPSVAANTAKISADGSVNTHSDVNYSGATEGQVLTWNATTNQWENRTQVVVSTLIDGLSNVGGGAEIYKDLVSKIARLRSIISSSGAVSIVQNSDTIDLDVALNSVSNLGTGSQIFRDVLSKAIRLRSLLSSSGAVTITQNANDIDFDVALNSVSNVGAGAAIYKDLLSKVIRLRSLISSGGTVTITQGVDTIDFDVALNTVSNVGTGAQIYKDVLSKSIRLRSIKSPTGSLTITQAADEVQVEVNASVIDVSSFANSKKTFQTLVVSGTVFTWNYANHYNAKIVFTSAGTRSLAITNAQNGDYGTILIDSTAAGATAPVLTLPAGSKVAANGLGAITLTAQGIDIWSWVYDGTNFYWTYGKQYT